MNVVLLIAITFTLALAHVYGQPYEWSSGKNPYCRFVCKHILQKSFNTDSKDEWEKYLWDQKLCDRPTRCQSFMMMEDQTRVKQICNGGGWPLLYDNSNRNLCISNSDMWVFDITVIDKERCKIKQPLKSMKKVIVACDFKHDPCLPVHFEKYINQQPDIRAGPCRGY